MYINKIEIHLKDMYAIAVLCQAHTTQMLNKKDVVVFMTILVFRSYLSFAAFQITVEISAFHRGICTSTIYIQIHHIDMVIS